jgi:hypothetical protein
MTSTTKRSHRPEGGGDFAPALGGGSGAKRACSPRDLISIGAPA